MSLSLSLSLSLSCANTEINPLSPSPPPSPSLTPTPASMTPTATTSDMTPSPNHAPIIIATGALAVVVASVLVILIVVLCYFCKKGKHFSPRDAPDIAEQGSYPNPSEHVPSVKAVQYRMVPQKSPSPAEDLISRTVTERTYLTNSQDSSPSHNTPSHHSSNSHCTCSCHEHDHSTLMPPNTLPFARYGYPEATISVHPQHYSHYQQEYCPENDGIPRIRFLPPTPSTPATEPFSVPSPVSPGDIPGNFHHPDNYSQKRPNQLGLRGDTRRGASDYASTPVSGEVAVNIAMYLMHKDCPNKESCPTCHLINRQFTHLLKQYERDHTVKEQPRHDTTKLRRRRSTRTTLPIPHFGRQRSMSTSEVNAEELTMSSNEDSTDAEVTSEHERRVKKEKSRNRDFSPLPLDAIPRELTVSDTELASSPSGHVPTPRRLPSPVKAHKPPTPNPPPLKSEEDSLPSSESLPTDESETSSRQGSDHNHEYSDMVVRSLPPPTRPSYHSVTSGYDTQYSSDADSVFFRPQTHKNRPELYSNPYSDTETVHHKKRSNHHTRPKKHQHNRNVTGSLQNTTYLQPSTGRQRLGSDRQSQSSDSHHSAQSDILGYSSHHRQELTPRPSSSSPYHSRQQRHPPYSGLSGSLTHLISLPNAGSQQTAL